jgi:hypothetical protein
VRRIQKITSLIAVAASAALGLTLAAPAAYAGYGGGAANNTWQLELSINCNNAVLCDQMQGGTGGEWIWGELDMAPGATVGTGDAQMTFCFHGGGFNGAGHTSEDVTSWMVGTNGDFWITGGTDTDRFRGQVDVHPIIGDDGVNPASPLNPVDLGIPALPQSAHYTTNDIFGFSAPGISASVQVAYRPAN